MREFPVGHPLMKFLFFFLSSTPKSLKVTWRKTDPRVKLVRVGRVLVRFGSRYGSIPFRNSNEWDPYDAPSPHFLCRKSGVPVVLVDLRRV